jgi:hypothetical protein
VGCERGSFCSATDPRPCRPEVPQRKSLPEAALHRARGVVWFPGLLFPATMVPKNAKERNELKMITDWRKSLDAIAEQPGWREEGGRDPDEGFQAHVLCGAASGSR